MHWTVDHNDRTCFFVEKYDLVGHLLKPGEDPADYTDTEEERSVSDRPKAE